MFQIPIHGQGGQGMSTAARVSLAQNGSRSPQVSSDLTFAAAPTTVHPTAECGAATHPPKTSCRFAITSGVAL